MLSENPVPTTGGDARKVVFAVIAVLGAGLVGLLLFTGGAEKAGSDNAAPAAAEQSK